jgi:hypothetical protein
MQYALQLLHQPASMALAPHSLQQQCQHSTQAMSMHASNSRL